MFGITVVAYSPGECWPIDFPTPPLLPDKKRAQRAMRLMKRMEKDPELFNMGLPEKEIPHSVFPKNRRSKH